MQASRHGTASSSRESLSPALFVLAMLLCLIFGTCWWAGAESTLQPSVENKVVDVLQDQSKPNATSDDDKGSSKLSNIALYVGVALLYGMGCCVFTWSYTYFDSHIPGCMPSSPLRLGSPIERSNVRPVQWHLPYVMAPVNGLLAALLYLYWQSRTELT